MHGRKSVAGIFYRILLRRYRYRYGFEINTEAQIDRGFYLTSHIGSVVIGLVKIGKNCNIGHLVTIGRGIAGERKGFATIGDNVWIGAGAVIVGNIQIGNSVIIAPNSYVNFNVPDNSVVFGNPGKIIKAKNPTLDYINYPVD
jgi:serine O-acetyltransferase